MGAYGLGCSRVPACAGMTYGAEELAVADAEGETEVGTPVWPVLVVRNTGAPADAPLPAPGSWPTITPAGAVLLGTSLTPPRAKPAALRVPSASG